MYRQPCHLKLNKGKFCSTACRNKAYPLPDGRNFPPPKYGPANPAWKDGVTYFRKHGNYKPIKYVRCPIEFLAMARKDGYVMEHRLIVATATGRALLGVEVVHHKNHDPQDNRLENLELFASNQEHKKTEGERGEYVRPAAACSIGSVLAQP
jgi:hypothetical protein